MFLDVLLVLFWKFLIVIFEPFKLGFQFLIFNGDGQDLCIFLANFLLDFSNILFLCVNFPIQGFKFFLKFLKFGPQALTLCSFVIKELLSGIEFILQRIDVLSESLLHFWTICKGVALFTYASLDIFQDGHQIGWDHLLDNILRNVLSRQFHNLFAFMALHRLPGQQVAPAQRRGMQGGRGVLEE